MRNLLRCRPAATAACMLAVLGPGCFYRTDPEPGLEIDAQGRIVRTDVRAYKARCQREVAAAVAEALGEGWRAEILIAEEPFPGVSDDAACYWRSITAVCRLSGPPEAKLPMDRFELIEFVRDRLQPYMRGDTRPYVELAGTSVE